MRSIQIALTVLFLSVPALAEHASAVSKIETVVSSECAEPVAIAGVTFASVNIRQKEEGSFESVIAISSRDGIKGVGLDSGNVYKVMVNSVHKYSQNEGRPTFWGTTSFLDVVGLFRVQYRQQFSFENEILTTKADEFKAICK